MREKDTHHLEVSLSLLLLLILPTTSIWIRKPRYSYVDGDGTVPAESAMADGFAAVERVGVSGTHRGLLRDETVFQLIREWLGMEKTRSKSSSSSTTSRVRDVCSD